MKTRLLSSLGALAVALLFPSCVALDDPYAYSGGNYSSGYNSDPGYYDSPGPVYGNRPPAYYGGSPDYGNNRYPYSNGRYPNGTVCPPSHYDHGHDDHRGGNSNRGSSGRSTTGATNRDIEGQRKNSKGERLWQYGGRERGAPEGNHTKDWYAERGHDLSKLKPAR